MAVRRRFRFVEAPKISDEEWWNYQLNVRSKYLLYEPEGLINLSYDHLKNIVRWYRPNSQPINRYEWAYLDLIATFAEELLAMDDAR